ncbi:basic amino acid ABC transporter substrate-binding protein [Thermoflavimicrobium dichotomicum]|uniref:Polar amino acid transport system substrate-binding protein n=1 Tax=Thermoflavimicrobium dichotomicum TaxID=46223 RepID=A0A1I3JXG8_9BACL|nr:basic amino acid ABC transporter substrate-binding protein [Thermoflavimicrobium dichotomicum]SFI64874.1 polar amino acid transport system substrate-binding protein [Thermoflavimicrobium dichotomicum]
MKKGFSVLLTAFLVMVFVVTGCGSKTDKAKKDTSSIQVGTNAEFPPFEKLEADGKITGFDAEILDAIAKATGMKAELKHMGFDAVFDGLDRGKLDAAIAAITITDERKNKYDFSEPYFEAKQWILVPKGSNIKSLKELNGKRIGVQSGTTGEEVVKAAFGKTYANLKGYDVVPAAVDDLQLKRLDAVVVDKAVAIDYLKKLGSDKFQTIEDPSLKTEYYGIAVKKGNKEVLNKINEGLKKIRQNGTYDKIYKKYFGNK